MNNIIGEDFLILLLSFSYSSSHPIFSILGLFLLQIAFWCIYELGYIENDVIGDKFEDKAILSHNYKTYEYSFGQWQPWLWSIILSIAGIVLVSKDQIMEQHPFISFPVNNYGYDPNWIFQEFVFWLAFLLILRFLFRVYNYINKQSRVWFYSLLQACRYCGFLVVFTTSITGLMFLVSCVLIRSIQYILYRYLGGKNSSWPMDFPRYFFCLLIYIMLVGIFAANERDLSLIINPHVLLICSFCILRGIKHFYNVFVHFLPVSEDGSNRVA